MRSYFHPMHYLVLLRGWAEVFGPPGRMALLYLPKMLQATIAALTDLFVYKISLLLHGPNTAYATLLCQTLSWFNFFTLVRTYS